MAARKTKPTPEPVEATPYDLGINSDDVTLPRLRVVGNQAKLVGLGVAKPGDIAIGQGAEDEDSIVVDKTDKVKFYVLAISSNFACGFDGPDGSWEEDDPERPAEAKKQYHYKLYVPEHESTLPVVYTASGTAAREARKLNTALATHCLKGAPYQVAFELSTKVNHGGGNSWPGPVFARATATDDEVAAAEAMHDGFVAPARTQLASGENTDPDY